jgi:hypothetical protein
MPSGFDQVLQAGCTQSMAERTFMQHPVQPFAKGLSAKPSLEAFGYKDKATSRIRPNPTR